MSDELIQQSKDILIAFGGKQVSNKIQFDCYRIEPKIYIHMINNKISSISSHLQLGEKIVIGLHIRINSHLISMFNLSYHICIDFKHNSQSYPSDENSSRTFTDTESVINALPRLFENFNLYCPDIRNREKFLWNSDDTRFKHAFEQCKYIKLENPDTSSVLKTYNEVYKDIYTFIHKEIQLIA